MAPMLEIQLLDDFRLLQHAHTENDVAFVRIDAGRLQSLLAYLVLHSRAPQSRQHLAFLFWPDTAEAQARTNLRNLLHRLRRVLPDAGTFLWSDTTLVQWRPDAPFACDALDFEAALAEAETYLQQAATYRSAASRFCRTASSHAHVRQEKFPDRTRR